jgi:hypothetical protein
VAPRRPSSTDETGPPPDSAVGAPVRDLHPVMDARFILTEVSKLTTQVERLIADVKEQGGKLDEVQHQISRVKGAVWLLGSLGLIVGLIAAFARHISFH